MPVTNASKTVVDLPQWQLLAPLPATRTTGACVCTDLRGTHRYAYVLLSMTSFWRYDLWTDSWQQLASPSATINGSVVAGTCMCFDPSQGTAGRVWLFVPYGSSPYAGFGYYDIATNAWTAKNVASMSLGAQWGTDGAMCHTCTTYNAGGNDDYIYLIGNTSTTWYRYSLSGNTWSTMGTALSGTALAGCSIHWAWGYNTDKLIIQRGGSYATWYIYTISTPAIATFSPVEGTETFAGGTCAVYNPEAGAGLYIYVHRNNYGQFYRFKCQATPILEPAGNCPVPESTAHVGQGIFFAQSADGLQYLYYMPTTLTFFVRVLVWW
jgi:hypothetical protein